MPKYGSSLEVLADARFRGAVLLDESAGATPDSGQISLYGSDGRLHSKDHTGAITKYATTEEVERTTYPVTKSWTLYGHSYLAGVFTMSRTSSLPELIREALGAEHTAWRNRAVYGSRLTIEKRAQGGWTRIYQETSNRPGRTQGPYTPDGGGMLLCYGINDITGADQSETSRQSFKMALRAAISRWRAATVWENNHDIGNRVTYTGSWGEDNFTFDVGSGNSVHYTLSAGGTITLKLPDDYKGEPVVLSFFGKDNASGGTATIGGTSGATGTIDTNNILPFFSFSRAPYVKRITGLTADAAGKTITITVTNVNGDFQFDCWWLESLTPPPVIVCNIPKLPASGYALYPSWVGSEASKDALIDSWNEAINEVAAEFDGMVQVADIDTPLNKDTYYFADGLHPNDAGGALVADAVVAAVRRLRPITGKSVAGSFAPSAPRQAPYVRVHRPGFWYTSDARGFGSNVTAVTGDMWAIPFLVTQPNARFYRIAVEAMNSVSGTRIRWGIYDDVDYSGYPQVLVVDPTANNYYSVSSGTGSKQSPANGDGSFNFIPGPGLYWLVVKFEQVGTSHNFRSLTGPSLLMPNLSASGTGTMNPTGWKLTGRTAGALDTVFPAGATLSDNCPMIALESY